MTTLTSTAALPLPAPDARAARVPQPGDAPAPGGSNFAEMLQQHRRAAPAADASAAPADAAATPVADAGPAAPTPQFAPRVAGRVTLPALPAAALTDAPALPAAQTSDAPAVEPVPETKARDDAQDSATPDADLRDWLAALPIDVPAQGPTQARAAGDAGPAGKAVASRAHPVEARAVGDAPAAASPAAGAAASPANVAPAESLFVRAAAAQFDAAAKPHEVAAPLVAGLPPAPAVLRTDAPAAPVQAALTPPLHSPEFAPALAAQVSILARDGVQRAELQLNPAEMGPISVHISIDGSDARVSFGAALGATRDAIERSLPELAAALHSEGLSFSGGGVSDQAAQPRPAAVARADRAGALPGAADAAPAVRGAAARRREGLLDLYA